MTGEARTVFDPVTLRRRPWSQAAPFEPGDVVRLKSGGPLMTVEGRGSRLGSLRCHWFSPDDHSKGIFEDFRAAMLVLASRNDGRGETIFTEAFERIA